MCGRFTQTQSGATIAQAFSLADAPNPRPRYNIAPSQPVLAIIQPKPSMGRVDRLFQWGLVPSWSKDLTIGHRLINARSETVHEKPSFRAAFKRRRCLIVADGFYEWQRVKGRKLKQPFYIHLNDHQPFGLAGLWEIWEGSDGSYLETCTILTTEPNELMQPLHDRMPVILQPEDYGTWLNPELQDPQRLQFLLCPYDAHQMQAYPVSTRVNSPQYLSPDCVEPLAAMEAD